MDWVWGPLGGCGIRWGVIARLCVFTSLHHPIYYKLSILRASNSTTQPHLYLNQTKPTNATFSNHASCPPRRSSHHYTCSPVPEDPPAGWTQDTHHQARTRDYRHHYHDYQDHSHNWWSPRSRYYCGPSPPPQAPCYHG